MAGLRTPGEPPAIWVSATAPLSQAPRFQRKPQLATDFGVLEPALPRPGPSQGSGNSCLPQDTDGTQAASSAPAHVSRSIANSAPATALCSFLTAGQGA